MNDNACIVTFEFPGICRIASYSMTLQWNELPSMALKYGPCMRCLDELHAAHILPDGFRTFLVVHFGTLLLLTGDPRKLPDKQDGKKKR